MATINWREWSNEAFEEARRTERLVLLDISAVWCHWCHVMDDTTYSDPEVIDIINEHFIPIRVDNDRNPDINARYNMGGWPTTAFLTHNRDVVTGATYVPPNQMTPLLQRLNSLYKQERDGLIEKAGKVRAETEAQISSGPTRSASIDDVTQVLDAIESAYDREFGGFGLGQKFPYTPVLQLLLLDYELTGEERRLAMATDTLRAMIAGDIFDRVEGGMFRYATQRDWRVPHYEKMLDDNARMAWVLLEAYRIDDSEDFLNAARNVFAYLENVLIDPKTALSHGSQDADEGYYMRDAEDRREMRSPRVDTAFYTDSNAAVAIAYLKLWSITRDNSSRDKALRIITFLNELETGFDGTICHYYEDGTPHNFGNLADHVALLSANINCHEATGDAAYLDNAQRLVESMFSAFGDETGALYDVSENLADERGISRYSIPISENARAAECLLRLADLAGDSYLALAGEVLDVLARLFTNYGIIASDYAISVALMHANRPLVTVNAIPGTAEADGFIQTSMAACGPVCSVKTIALNGDHTPSAAVCTRVLCRARVTQPEELADQLIKLLSEIREPQPCS